MIVVIRLFARAKDLAGASTLELELPEASTVRDLRRQLPVAYPALAQLLSKSALAIHDELVDDDCPVRDGDHVALLPPVSGG